MRAHLWCLGGSTPYVVPYNEAGGRVHEPEGAVIMRVWFSVGPFGLNVVGASRPELNHWITQGAAPMSLYLGLHQPPSGAKTVSLAKAKLR